MTSASAAAQALLTNAASNAVEAVRSGNIADVFTLALKRAVGTAVASLVDAWREGERAMSQLQSGTRGDPTADAEGVTDSQARARPPDPVQTLNPTPNPNPTPTQHWPLIRRFAVSDSDL
jgi:hypothetical protein